MTTLVNVSHFWLPTYHNFIKDPQICLEFAAVSEN
jgi:hypothetical protein